MARSIGSGDRIDYTPGSDVAAGAVVVIGDLVAVADQDIPANKLGALSVNGLKGFPKASGGSTAITAGALLYWDATNKVATTTASSHKKIGLCAKAAADGDTEVFALLGSRA